MNKNLLNKVDAEFERRYPGRLLLDGVIDEEAFAGVQPGILWILKEPNNSSPVGGDFRGWMREHLAEYHNWRRTYARVLQISYALLHDLDRFAEVPDAGKLLSTIGQIAYINVKKTGGGAASSPSVIAAHFERDRDLLAQQIEAVEPDIILHCSGVAALGDALGGHGAKGMNQRGALVANLYHPNCRQKGWTQRHYFEDALQKLNLDAQRRGGSLKSVLAKGGNKQKGPIL